MSLPGLWDLEISALKGGWPVLFPVFPKTRSVLTILSVYKELALTYWQQKKTLPQAITMGIAGRDKLK